MGTIQRAAIGFAGMFLLFSLYVFAQPPLEAVSAARYTKLADITYASVG